MNDVALYNQPHTAVLYVDNAMIPVVVGGQTGPAGATGPAAVSYTHLTLPTNREV